VGVAGLATFLTAETALGGSLNRASSLGGACLGAASGVVAQLVLTAVFDHVLGLGSECFSWPFGVGLVGIGSAVGYERFAKRKL